MDLNQSDQQLTKRERRELRRQEQKERQKLDQRKNTQNRILKWTAGLLAIGIIGYGLFLLISRATTPRPGESIAIQGRDHISVGSSHPEYNSNPPTSGPHYSQPTPWGVYQDELKDENVIHSMEHGGIWISYQPDIDDETKAKIEAIGKKHSGSVVVSPRSANDSLIALASWGRLEKLSLFDEAQIIEFIKRNKNKSPEPLAR
ncbi:hypothetical protein BK004_02760 [bacterium CG10_46_32]|nr:MAG: hypothetical protein BK004_02760 [bacterium CG10_46_32]PIR56065.1 MAG: hypothetical protein COU73_02790 [Parcubacteria group bacterium CG10_big_fil_rev_8_21_14_0_10_46_32]